MITREEYIKRRQAGETPEQILGKQATQVSSSVPQEKPGLLKFIARDTLGTSTGAEKPTGVKGFLANVYQSTLGSKGAAGLGALIPKAIGTVANVKTQKQLNDSTDSLIEINEKIVDIIKKTDDPAKKEKYLNLYKQNMEILQGGRDAFTKLESDNLNTGEVAGTTLNTALTAATGGMGPKLGTKLVTATGATGKAAGALKLAGTAAENAAIGAGFNTADNLTEGRKVAENLGLSLTLGAGLTVLGAGASRTRELFGKGIQKTGRKIQKTVIKPSLRDEKDGFLVDNIEKYKLGGGLKDTIEAGNGQLNMLNQQLNKLIKKGSPGTSIDLKDVLEKTAKSLQNKNKGANFGQASSMERAMLEIAEEISKLEKSGVIDLPTAQVVKRAAGANGAWVNGLADKDAKAKEIVYTRFYQILKTQIEKKSGSSTEIRALNKKMSEIIPIVNAAIRRLPIAERNNPIGINDMIGLMGSFYDPRAAVLVVANRAAKSGKVGASLTKAGTNLVKKQVKTNIGKRLLGR